jgi:hypothetical protein
VNLLPSLVSHTDDPVDDLLAWWLGRARRSEIQEEQANNFKRDLVRVYKNNQRRNILNADENGWLTVWQPKLTVTEAGPESGKRHLGEHPKAGTTLVRTNATDASKPFCFWSSEEQVTLALMMSRNEIRQSVIRE